MKLKNFKKNISLYTPMEIADFLGVPKRTIYDWVHKRKIPHKKVGRLLRFDLDEINEWVNSQSAPTQESTDARAIW